MFVTSSCSINVTSSHSFLLKLTDSLSARLWTCATTLFLSPSHWPRSSHPLTWRHLPSTIVWVSNMSGRWALELEDCCKESWFHQSFSFPLLALPSGTKWDLDLSMKLSYMAALSFAYAFSHNPWETGRGGDTGLLLEAYLNISFLKFHVVTVTTTIKNCVTTVLLHYLSNRILRLIPWPT